MVWCLPWYTPQCELIKLKSIRGLIEYYLGNFLEKITLDQLSVNFYNGTGTVRDVTLKCDELHRLGDKEKWPLIIKKGNMEDISVRMPWKKYSKGDSMVKIDGLSLTVQTKAREEPVISVLNWISSIWSTWAKWSSSKLCLNRKEQLDLLADFQIGQMDFISDVIYSKIKYIHVKFVNTKIIVEHMPKDIDQGIVLVIYIKNFDYYEGNISDQTSDELDSDKRIILDGITLSTVELLTDNSNYHSLGIKDSLGSQKLKDYKSNKIRSLTPESVDSQINTVINAIESKPVQQATTDSNGIKELTLDTKINERLQFCLP